MSRELRPCGTFAAYRRHLRSGEEPCDPCRGAAREQRQQRRKPASVAPVVEFVPTPPTPDAPEPEGIDELEKLRWNLRVTEAAMDAGVSSGLAALAKHHAELVRAIRALELATEPRESKIDELARRRAERIAAAAN